MSAEPEGHSKGTSPAPLRPSISDAASEPHLIQGGFQPPPSSTFSFNEKSIRTNFFNSFDQTNIILTDSHSDHQVFLLVSPTVLPSDQQYLSQWKAIQYALQHASPPIMISTQALQKEMVEFLKTNAEAKQEFEHRFHDIDKRMVTYELQKDCWGDELSIEIFSMLYQQHVHLTLWEIEAQEYPEHYEVHDFLGEKRSKARNQFKNFNERAIKIKKHQEYPIKTGEHGESSQVKSDPKTNVNMLSLYSPQHHRFAYYYLHQVPDEILNSVIGGKIVSCKMEKKSVKVGIPHWQNRVINFWQQFLQYGEKDKQGKETFKGIVYYWMIQDIKAHHRGLHDEIVFDLGRGDTLTLRLEESDDTPTATKNYRRKFIEQIKSFVDDHRQYYRVAACKFLSIDLADLHPPRGQYWKSEFGCDHPYPALFEGELEKESHDGEHRKQKRWFRFYKNRDEHTEKVFYTLEYVDHEDSWDIKGKLQLCYIQKLITAQTQDITEYPHKLKSKQIILYIDEGRQFDLLARNESDYKKWVHLFNLAREDEKRCTPPAEPLFWREFTVPRNRENLRLSVSILENGMKNAKGYIDAHKLHCQHLTVDDISFSTVRAEIKKLPLESNSQLEELFHRLATIAFTDGGRGGTWCDQFIEIMKTDSDHAKYVALLLVLNFCSHDHQDNQLWAQLWVQYSNRSLADLHLYANDTNEKDNSWLKKLQPQTTLTRILEAVKEQSISSYLYYNQILVVRLVHMLSLGLLKDGPNPPDFPIDQDVAKKAFETLRTIQATLKDDHQISLWGHKHYCLFKITIVKAILILAIHPIQLNGQTVVCGVLSAAASIFSFGTIQSSLGPATSHAYDFAKDYIDRKHIDRWMAKVVTYWILNPNPINLGSITKILIESKELFSAKASLGGDWQTCLTYLEFLHSLIRRIAMMPDQEKHMKSGLNFLLLRDGILFAAEFAETKFARDWRIREKAIHIAVSILIENRQLEIHPIGWHYQPELIKELEQLILKQFLKHFEDFKDYAAEHKKSWGDVDTLQQFLFYQKDLMVTSMHHAWPRLKNVIRAQLQSEFNALLKEHHKKVHSGKAHNFKRTTTPPSSNNTQSEFKVDHSQAHIATVTPLPNETGGLVVPHQAERNSMEDYSSTSNSTTSITSTATLSVSNQVDPSTFHPDIASLVTDPSHVVSLPSFYGELKSGTIRRQSVTAVMAASDLICRKHEGDNLVTANTGLPPQPNEAKEAERKIQSGTVHYGKHKFSCLRDLFQHLKIESSLAIFESRHIELDQLLRMSNSDLTDVPGLNPRHQFILREYINLFQKAQRHSQLKKHDVPFNSSRIIYGKEIHHKSLQVDSNLNRAKNESSSDDDDESPTLDDCSI